MLGDKNKSKATTTAAAAAAAAAMPPESTFRAIIVGGGPAGLGMAHALSLAGIDWVMLERGGDVVVDSGASLAIWPHNVRILDQFGLLEDAMRLYMPLKTKHNLRPDGTEIATNNMFEEIENCHGHPWMLFHRPDLLELLYRKLPHKRGRILTNKNVVNIETKPNGVNVFCEDGAIEEGSIVIGCDGVHSTIRRLMREMALRSSAKVSYGEKPMKTCYQGLIGYLDLIDGLKSGEVWEVRSNKMSLQVLCGPRVAYFFVYQRLSKPSYERVTYNDEDAEKFAQTVLEHPVAKDLKVKDLWKARKWARMVNFEEGFLKTWHFDRIVLVGDAVHKMTPHAGFSLNTGWQGVVELTNRLRSLLEMSPNPDTNTLQKLFKGYQGSRERIAKTTAMFSGLYTRIVAWQNMGCKMADWFCPYLGGDNLMLGLMVSPIVKKGITLDFVEETGHKEGKVQWVNKHKMKSSRVHVFSGPGGSDMTADIKAMMG